MTFRNSSQITNLAVFSLKVSSSNQNFPIALCFSFLPFVIISCMYEFCLGRQICKALTFKVQWFHQNILEQWPMEYFGTVFDRIFWEQRPVKYFGNNDLWSCNGIFWNILEQCPVKRPQSNLTMRRISGNLLERQTFQIWVRTPHCEANPVKPQFYKKVFSLSFIRTLFFSAKSPFSVFSTFSNRKVLVLVSV